MLGGRNSLYQVLRRVERRRAGGGLGDPGFTLLGSFAVSWGFGWLSGRPLPLLEVKSAVKAFRALIAHLRLTGRLAGLGFLAALYF